MYIGTLEMKQGEKASSRVPPAARKGYAVVHWSQALIPAETGGTVSRVPQESI